MEVKDLTQQVLGDLEFICFSNIAISYLNISVMKASKPKYARLVGAQLLAMPPCIELTLEYAALRGFHSRKISLSQLPNR